MNSEIESLVNQLNAASDAYYNGKGELMSDYEWDAAFDRLKKLEGETGIILSDSPTQNVSADNVIGQKEQHEFAALSLAKTKKVIDLTKWADNRPIWLSWKLDGLTLVVTYDNGKLIKVVTRGNGHIGTNITHLYKAIDGILDTIPYKGHLVIRGEAIISYADFEQFNMESEEEYANPRNLASGSLSMKDINEVKKRHILWIPFTLVYIEEETVSWGERMKWLEEQGFNVVEREFIEKPTEKNIQGVINHWSNTSSVYPYPVDGLVIAYDDTVYGASGSITGHHATRAGYAFKWQDKSVETELEYIEWSCATSTITPIAVFKPTEIEGTTVKRASLCNISECERLGIGDKGTKIAVIKANKIIPKVINVIERLGVFHIPEVCPVCQSATEVIESESSGTKTLHCTNTHCPAKQLKKFGRFVSKEGINIDGLSEQTIQKFINLGWVREYADLFHLNNHASELRTMEGFGDKSVSKLLTAIEKARDVEAHRLLFALNIPLIGRDVCKRLLSVYSFNELIDIAKESNDENIFSKINGIGDEKSSSFVKWIHNDDNYAILNRLLKEVNIINTSNISNGNKCKELTFVITGDLHHYNNRNELKTYIESQGGRITSSISKSTNFLINNDIESSSHKNKMANKLSIPIISENEFIDKFMYK